MKADGALSVSPIWWTWEARIAGVGGIPSGSGSRESSAAAQPSPKIAEPTVFAFGSSGVARVSVLLMLSAATTSVLRSG